MFREFIYLLITVGALSLMFFLIKNHGKEMKLFIIVYLTIYLIYHLTTPSLTYYPWIAPDDVKTGPPIHLFYPKNPLGWVVRKRKRKKKKKPSMDFRLLY